MAVIKKNDFRLTALVLSLPRAVISSRFSTTNYDQSQYICWFSTSQKLYTFPALGASCMFASSSDWFIAFFLLIVIGQFISNT